MSTYSELLNNLEILQLTKIKELMPTILESKNNKSIIDILLDLTKAEIKSKDERARKINITVSSFPYYKTIEEFDFDYQPTIPKQKVLNLASLNFLTEKSNIIFIGSPGTGKTHLATALGIEAASQRISTYFINFAELMEKFRVASIENRLEKIIKHYNKYSLLIIDEIGYQPVDKNSSYAFFQLIAARYENRSVILTTNQPFSKWGEVFGDSVIANAIIDRLVHHCEIIKINGISYRLKGKSIFEDEG